MHAGDATGEDAHDQSTEEGGDPEPGEVVQPFARRAARDDRVQSDGGEAKGHLAALIADVEAALASIEGEIAA